MAFSFAPPQSFCSIGGRINQRPGVVSTEALCGYKGESDVFSGYLLLRVCHPHTSRQERRRGYPHRAALSGSFFAPRTAQNL